MSGGVWEVRLVEFNNQLYVEYGVYELLLEKYTNAMEVMLIEDQEYWEVENVREQEAKAVLEENKLLKGRVVELELKLEEMDCLYKSAQADNLLAHQRIRQLLIG